MSPQEKTGKSPAILRRRPLLNAMIRMLAATSGPCTAVRRRSVSRADDRAVHAIRPAPLEALGELIRQAGFVTDDLSLAARRFSMSYFTL